MQNKRIFENYNIFLHLEDANEFEDIKQRLLRNGANKVFTSEDIQSDETIVFNLSHIISKSINFPQYEFSQEYMIPIVSPEWVNASLKAGRLSSLRSFFPADDLARLFKKFIFSIDDSIPNVDSKLYKIIIEEYGGQWQPQITKFTTHVISVDISSDSCIIANSIPNLDIVCIIPQYIEDSIKSQKLQDESLYQVNNPRIFSNEKFDTEKQLYQKFGDNIEDVNKTNLFENKSFYLARDLNEFTPKLIKLLRLLIESNGGTCHNKIDQLKNIQLCYVGQFRTADEYVAASKNSYIVGNPTWLLHIISHGKFSLPFENLLHYPLSKTGIPEFHSLKFCTTNYTGDTRIYLQKLIIGLGAQYLGNLDKTVDFLISNKPVGNKYLASTVKKNKIFKVKIRTHGWIEQCFLHWKLLSDRQFSKVDIPNFTQKDQLLGSVKYDSQLVKKFYETAHTGRKAAMKAAIKLHSDIEDLNQFTKNKSRIEDSTWLSQSNKKVALEKIHLPNKRYDFRIMLTGGVDESEYNVLSLGSLGIHIENNTSKVNVLIAPRIVRTEKFLTCLGNGLKYILHPKFLEDVVRKDNIKVEDYSLDNYNANLDLPISVKELLKRQQEIIGNGKLFKHFKFNVTSNVAVSSSILNRILKGNGMTSKAKTFRSPGRFTIKSLEQSDNGFYYMIANRDSDHELIDKFYSVCKEKGIAVEWNWIVAGLFEMRLDNHEEFTIKKQ